VPTYSSTTAGSGSSLAVHTSGLGGKQFLNSTWMADVIGSNWGFEAFVSPDFSSRNHQWIAVTEHQSGSDRGAGFKFRGSSAGGAADTYEGEVIQAATISTGNAAAVGYTHLAAVFDNNVMKFYINGVDVTDTNGVAALGGPDDLFVGRPSYDATEVFDGLLDQLHVFTFIDGEFEVSDLTLSLTAETVPEPSTYVLSLIGMAGLGLVVWRRRK